MGERSRGLPGNKVTVSVVSLSLLHLMSIVDSRKNCPDQDLGIWATIPTKVVDGATDKVSHFTSSQKKTEDCFADGINNDSRQIRD